MRSGLGAAAGGPPGRGRAGRVATALLVGVVTAALAACESGAPTAAPTPTRAPDPTPTTTRYDLRTTIWYAGLVLHFGEAIATLDERGGPVTLGLRLDNTGTEAAELNGKIWLVVNGERIEPTRESRVPTVPGKGSAGAVLTYELQGIDEVDEAVIEVGDEPLHVARVPLTPAAGTPVAFEPIALELKGAQTAGSVRITLRTGLLRWDLPDWLEELDAGLRALTLTYDVTYAGDFSGGLAFTGDNVALRLPDGKRVEARKDGHSQSIELIGARKTKKDLFSRFEIPAGATGKFALLVRSGSTERAIEFTIED
ncbi:MAG TPA: hypothetical protein VMQ65_05785 [Candidatus Limnocylindria bacterium]|nr:hypothetical protein [Candidatus Limnocylindria bacterium]